MPSDDVIIKRLEAGANKKITNAENSEYADRIKQGYVTTVDHFRRKRRARKFEWLSGVFESGPVPISEKALRQPDLSVKYRHPEGLPHTLPSLNHSPTF